MRARERPQNGKKGRSRGGLVLEEKRKKIKRERERNENVRVGIRSSRTRATYQHNCRDRIKEKGRAKEEEEAEARGRGQLSERIHGQVPLFAAFTVERQPRGGTQSVGISEPCAIAFIVRRGALHRPCNLNVRACVRVPWTRTATRIIRRLPTTYVHRVPLRAAVFLTSPLSGRGF